MPRPKAILTVRVQGHRTFTKGEHGKPGRIIDYSVKVDDIDCVTGETCNPLIPLTDRQMLFDAAAQGLLPDSQRHILGAITSAEQFFENAELHADLHDERDKPREHGLKGIESRNKIRQGKKARCLTVLREIGFPQRDLNLTAMAKYYLMQTKAWNAHLLEGERRPSVQTLRKRLIPEFIRNEEERMKTQK